VKQQKKVFMTVFTLTVKQ